MLSKKSLRNLKTKGTHHARLDRKNSSDRSHPQTSTITENDEHSRRLFLGGRGRNSHLLYRLVPAQADPFGPDNAVIFGTGPLAGTLAPGCARCTVTAKSPLTGILGDANFGGFLRAGHEAGRL